MFTPFILDRDKARTEHEYQEQIDNIYSVMLNIFQQKLYDLASLMAPLNPASTKGANRKPPDNMAAADDDGETAV